MWNDCCSDIADTGCHPTYSTFPMVSPTPTETHGKTKFEAHTIHYCHSFLNKLIFINNNT